MLIKNDTIYKGILNEWNNKNTLIKEDIEFFETLESSIVNFRKAELKRMFYFTKDEKWYHMNISELKMNSEILKKYSFHLFKYLENLRKYTIFKKDDNDFVSVTEMDQISFLLIPKNQESSWMKKNKEIVAQSIQHLFHLNNESYQMILKKFKITKRKFQDDEDDIVEKEKPCKKQKSIENEPMCDIVLSENISNLSVKDNEAKYNEEKQTKGKPTEEEKPTEENYTEGKYRNEIEKERSISLPIHHHPQTFIPQSFQSLVDQEQSKESEPPEDFTIDDMYD